MIKIQKRAEMRQIIRLPAAILGFILFFYLILCFLGLVTPVEIKPLGMYLLHFIGQCTMICFLIAAWGYWEI